MFPTEQVLDCYRRAGVSRREIDAASMTMSIVLGRYEEALASCARLELEDDSDPHLRLQAGTLHLVCRHHTEAESRLRTCALEHGFPDAWNNLGVLLRRTGDESGAQACFDAALRLFPDYRDAGANLRDSAVGAITERPLRPLSQIAR